MYFALSPMCSEADRLGYMFDPQRIKVLHYSSEPKPWSRVLEEKYGKYTDDEWVEEILHSFNGYHAWVLKEPTLMKKEADRSGQAALGPDGCMHQID
eukprot:372260-Amphidinium_carterae.1